ncbi:hypothetical protein DYB28_004311 [Aphanomyces astaci]|uniref:Protein kinase domain-containing protein n=1 Tax=Aphanomyces astaci TaxID=112090 RepID=A0A9X8H8T1_APHAT|nr:hypothetical protein DYB28_004311 [Aphanomyces astaci]
MVKSEDAAVSKDSDEKSLQKRLKRRPYIRSKMREYREKEKLELAYLRAHAQALDAELRHFTKQHQSTRSKHQPSVLSPLSWQHVKDALHGARKAIEADRESLTNQVEDAQEVVREMTTWVAMHRRIPVTFGQYEVESEPIYRSGTSVVVKAVDAGLCNRVFDKVVRRKTKGMTDKEFFAAMNLLVLASSTLPTFLQDPEVPHQRVWGDQFDDVLSPDGSPISLDAFSSYTSSIFGPLTVAIKFMSDSTAYDKETNLRRMHKDMSVLPLLPTESLEWFQDATKSLVLQGDSLASYPYAIVMPYASMTLADELSIALSAFHQEQHVHGDVTPLDVVFVHGKLYVIDGDASARIADRQLPVKFSTSILPPGSTLFILIIRCIL